jgi:hypothetical protein
VKLHKRKAPSEVYRYKLAMIKIGQTAATASCKAPYKSVTGVPFETGRALLHEDISPSSHPSEWFLSRGHPALS